MLTTAYHRLPKELQNTVRSPLLKPALRGIARNNKLVEELDASLEHEVLLVLLGLIPKEKFAEQLIAELNLPPEQARAIAGDIEKEIFNTNIRMNTNLQMATNKTETKPTTTPPINLPTPPCPVLIRKELPPPPRQNSEQVHQVPTIQSLLVDIKRGTAYDDNRINEAFRKTPIEVKQSLESVGFLSRLEGVAKKFGLNVEETGELVSEAGLVMLGLTQPVNFVDNLTRRLRLPRDRAMAVGQSVNMEVLRPVREILRNMNTNIRMNTNLQMATNKTGEEQEQKTEGKYRFAPTTEPPKNLPIAAPNYSPQSTPTQNNYSKDPYREPLE